MNLLEIKDLTIQYETEGGIVHAVNNVSLNIEKGTTVGLVGETGAGKTTTALGVMRLIPSPPGVIVSGEILFDGEDLLKKSWKQHIYDLSRPYDCAEPGAASGRSNC